MRDIAVSFQHVTKSYGRKRALADVSLAIPRGCVVGILGPNGAGKSTLFRILTGLVHPEVGEVRVLGDFPGWRTNRHVAYLPDRARWYPDHTVADAIRWAETFLPGFHPATARRLAELLRLDLQLRAGHMSRGQEARLMLLICLARRVPLVVLDEPLTGIDAPSRARILESIISILSEEREEDRPTVLLSTHELHEAEPLLDYVVFLADGRVALEGTAEELRQQHGSMSDILESLVP
ncbi:MAG: ABC transporter ATP-binding protein [Alicyclobacillus sp.]|nr:ABC transporter ATP-binding protein [Alicyclobacillus sp.]